MHDGCSGRKHPSRMDLAMRFFIPGDGSRFQLEFNICLISSFYNDLKMKRVRKGTYYERTE